MRDLSLHILDLIENSIRAQATVVQVTIVENRAQDVLQVLIEDNGPGLSVPADVATNPFYTTKSGKRIGLGLSLLRAASEQAGGHLILAQSRLGGLAVKATMRLSHVDRTPLGDLAATFSSVVCTNPGLDLCVRLCLDDQEHIVRAADVARELPANERGGLTIARRVSDRVKNALASASLAAV